MIIQNKSESPFVFFHPRLNNGTNILVFGSNISGRHGKGAALQAINFWGAIYGKGEGRHGNSYAIPTKGVHMEILKLYTIHQHVSRFLEYAWLNPKLTFLVTRIGCGLAGYKDEEIAPMFNGASDNCQLPEGWREMSQS